VLPVPGLTFSLLLKICWLLALAGHHFFAEKCSVVFSNPPHQETLKSTTKQKKKNRGKGETRYFYFLGKKFSTWIFCEIRFWCFRTPLAEKR
jgi:hypothetical protein